MNTTSEENQGIFLQEVSKDTLTFNVNGEALEILKKLDVLQDFLEKQQSRTFQSAGKIINIQTVSNANFGFLVEQTGHQKNLPESIAEELVTDDDGWVESIKLELKNRQRVSVGNSPSSIFQHFGWLIEEFLRKMKTPPGQERSLRRLSFMAEVFQASLKYLCFIQIAQLLKLKQVPKHPTLKEFVQSGENQGDTFDYLNLLLVTTELLPKEKAFMPAIFDFVQELSDTQSDLYGTSLFLEKYRNLLLKNEIPENEQLDQLLDQYLTGLVFWLRKITFLAKYRLASVKNINLQYSLGTTKNFVHLYGELHGIYAGSTIGLDDNSKKDYREQSVEGLFTFNQSVLLFNGTHVETCLNNISDDSSYISLSPLVIDYSVFSGNGTDTPDIYYYTGYQSRQYQFARYNNELPFGDQKVIASNKVIGVKAENDQPKFNELFYQMEQVLKPFKSVGT